MWLVYILLLLTILLAFNSANWAGFCGCLALCKTGLSAIMLGNPVILVMIKSFLFAGYFYSAGLVFGVYLIVNELKIGKNLPLISISGNNPPTQRQSLYYG